MPVLQVRCVTLTPLIISGNSSATAEEENDLSIQLSANFTIDTWEVLTSDGNITVDSNGLVGITEFDTPGTWNAVIQATDEFGRTATKSVTFVLTAIPEDPEEGNPPSIVTAPVLSGVTVPGNTLSVTNGVWADDPDSYAYSVLSADLVWEDDFTDQLVDDNLDFITDGSETELGTAATYDITSGEIGRSIRWLVTATNEWGSGEAYSNLSNTVTNPSFADAYVSSGFKETAGSSHTWSSQSIGPANSSRVLLIVLETQGGTAAQHAEVSVTIGQTTSQATKLEQATLSASTLQMSVWAVVAPQGTSGTIFARYSSDAEIATSVARATIHVYAHARTVTPTATARSSSVGPYAFGITIPTGGAAFCFTQTSLAGTPTCTWTNATENYDHKLTTGNIASSGAIRSTAGSTTITSTWSAGTPQRFIYIAFGPAS